MGSITGPTGPQLFCAGRGRPEVGSDVVGQGEDDNGLRAGRLIRRGSEGS